MGQKYVWQRSDWPSWTWDAVRLLGPLAKARRLQGQILAHADLIGLEAQASLLVEEAVNTSAIEGEKLNRDSVRSSVARRLGLSTSGLPPQLRSVDGLVEMLVDATSKFEKLLNQKRLFAWQATLFPTGYSGLQKIEVGGWRKSSEPMQVISEKKGRTTVHFEAPPSSRVPKEMKAFLEWWDGPSKNIDGILRAGIAHFWFVTIHPFEDGNGRIARAITDMALSQDERKGYRLYSLSLQIVSERESYYEILEQSQKKTTDLTDWLEWFLATYCLSIERSEGLIKKALSVANFWKEHNQSELNARQVKVITRLLEVEDFEGGMTNRKYTSLTKVSRETAKRDLAELESKGILKRNAGQGRSVSYSLRTKRNW